MEDIGKICLDKIFSKWKGDNISVKVNKVFKMKGQKVSITGISHL